MQRVSTAREWVLLAACRDGDPDALFVRGASQNVAKRICAGCPVRVDCLADAMDNNIDSGVWGGMTERERRALRRRHPAVRDWSAMLASTQRAAMRAHAGRQPRTGGRSRAP